MRNTFLLSQLRVSTRRQPARTQSNGLPRTTASQRLPLLLSPEHLVTERLYQRKRQEPLIPRRSIVPQFSQRQICRPRIQRAMPFSGIELCRITRQKQTGRQQTGRTIDRSLTVQNQFRLNQIIHRRCIRTIRRNPTGMSLLASHKRLPQPSVRSPSVLLLLKKNSVRRRNNSAPSRRL